MNNYETLNHANCEIQIHQDTDPCNPRTDWDHLGTMVCFHDRYDLGDPDGLSQLQDDIRSSRYYRDSWEDSYNDHMLDLDNPADLQTAMIRCRILALPLYLYDHSGITMSTGAFSCPWDSGQVGFIYMLRETAIENWGKKVCTRKVSESAHKCLESEVEEYDQYLTGDVYGYVIEHRESGEEESVWGFYGYEYCIREAKESAQYLDTQHQETLRQVERDRQSRLCTMIRNHVPLGARQIEMRSWT